MSHESTDPVIKPGEFPYPPTHRSSESPFLTWLRNHSNFLAVRGLLDYFRLGAVLLRGVVINQVVILPYLLGLSLVVGLVYGTLLIDWDEKLVPTEDFNKAEEDVRFAADEEADKSGRDQAAANWVNPKFESGKKNEKLLLTDRREKAKVNSRRATAHIQFFLYDLDVKKAPFRHEDIFDQKHPNKSKLSGLADRLIKKERPVDRWVAERLDKKTNDALESYCANPTSGENKEKLADALYEDFNLLLHDPFLYSEDRFGDELESEQKPEKVTMRPGTIRLAEQIPNSQHLTIGGFTNLPMLAYVLKNPDRPVDVWLANQLSPETHKALVEYQGATSDPAPLQRALAISLEGLVRGPSIYREATFKGIVLRKKTESLLDDFINIKSPWNSPRGIDNIARLNRLLIEDSYPMYLWWNIGGVDQSCFNHLLLEDAYPELQKRHGGWVMWMQDHLGLTPPFILTPVVLALTAAWVLFFPIVTIMAKMFGYQRIIAARTKSAIKTRDLYERTFGFCLFAILAVGLFELTPLVVHFYHQFRVTHLDGELPWKHYIAAAATTLSVLSGAQKFTSLLGGATRKLAVFAIGLLGLLAPYLVIVFATDFLVYSDLPANFDNTLNLMVPILLTTVCYAFVIFLTLAVGLAIRTFSARDARRLVLMLFRVVFYHLLLILVIVVVYAVLYFLKDSIPGILLTPDPTPSLLPPEKYGDLSAYFVLVVALEVGLFCWLAVDINATSIHGVYRDRLAFAYLLRFKRNKDVEEVDVEDVVQLGDLCCYDADSTAPYHIINAALNLQGSKDLGIRDRRSEFFIFSKEFIGGARTGYCRTMTMEQVFPQLDLASAMAISAAAAAPNMGRNTSPWLVPLLTLINVRLGVWVPHPGRLAETAHIQPGLRKSGLNEGGHRLGYAFEDVFRTELKAVQKRWLRLGAARQLKENITTPTPAHGLAGIGFSGGGIRSATVNLGIAQALHDAGIFSHFDYMSTVSGGGFLGSSISALMRFKIPPYSSIAGTVSVVVEDGKKIVTITPAKAGSPEVHRYPADADLAVKSDDKVKAGQWLLRRAGPRMRSEIAGTATLSRTADDALVIGISAGPSGETREYRYEKYEKPCVEDGQVVKAGDFLIRDTSSPVNRFRWRIRPRALAREMTMRVDDSWRWVNLSDGGHLENLAAIELLRRRCKLIVVGDGEADPEMHFNGLATLMRTAFIDMGITIEINVDALRLNKDRQSGTHYAIGQISYPGETEEYGYLLYLKSSFTGDEHEVITEYRHRSPAFPQEPTADQFFDEGQFEAYRALGQHIGRQAIYALTAGAPNERDAVASYAGLARCFEELWKREGEKLTPSLLV